MKKEYAKELLPYKGRLNNIQILKEYLLKDTYYEQIIKKLGFYSHILKDLEGDKILFRDFQDFVNSNEYVFFAYAESTEFEIYASTLCDDNKEINPQILNNKWKELQSYYKYNTLNVESMDKEWIDNYVVFSNNFYGCSYAIDIICALKFARDVLSGEKEKIDNYRKFLTLGGSDYPLELLKQGGVDLTTDKPYEEAFAFLREKIAECKLLAKEIKQEIDAEKFAQNSDAKAIDKK